MIDAGIHAGDLLIVDRGLSAQTDQIVIAIVDGDFTVKRLGRLHGRPALIPDNQAYAPICLQEGQELQIWGVVVGCVKKYVL
jgi:DNA polymerase V